MQLLQYNENVQIQNPGYDIYAIKYNTTRGGLSS